MVILYPKKLLRKFRDECKKRYPLETLTAIFGQRAPNGDVMITRLEHIAGRTSESQVEISDHNIRKSKISALRGQDDWLGTIHSHCWTKEVDCCGHLSEADVLSAVEFGETICGVVYVYDSGKKSVLNWYVPTPLPVAKGY